MSGYQDALSFLAEINPATIALQIERSLNNMGPSELAHQVRPALIRAVAKIAFDSSTFAVGARLLLRLAIAEEQTVSSMDDQLRRVYRGGPSGATVAFQSLFPVLLGNTAADGKARLSLLDEALPADAPIQLLIVTKALIEGLETSHFSRQVVPEIHGSRRSLTEWRPSTQRQLDEYVRGCVIRLGSVATNDDEAGTAARAGIAQALSSLVAACYIDTVEAVFLQVSAVVSVPRSEFE